ncbi:MAG: hypothetical protein A2977_03480, partial [Alphaproteobacteria bacterium RIFCSPLOWO2_01_FULL_45_8]
MENRFLSNLDVPGMEQLLREGFPASLWSAHDLHKFMMLDSCQAWGAFQGDQLRGFSFIQMAADEAEILLIVVHPSVRRQKIAHNLLEKTEAYLRKRKISHLFLEVSVENEAAFHFYTKVGFTITGNRKDYYSNKQNKSAH